MKDNLWSFFRQRLKHLFFVGDINGIILDAWNAVGGGIYVEDGYAGWRGECEELGYHAVAEEAAAADYEGGGDGG